MRDSIFYTICIAFASGIFIRSFFSIDTPAILTVLFLGLAYLLLWWRRGYSLETKQFVSPLFFTGLALVFGGMGLLRLEVSDRTTPLMFSEVLGEEMVLEGVVVREPDVRERVQYIQVRIDEAHTLVQASLNRHESVSYGDLVTITGRLEMPKSFETELGKTFNYPGYLKARGVTYVMPFAEVEVLKVGEGNPYMHALLGTKKLFLESIEQIIPEPAAGLGAGLLLGMKRALGEELENVFRITGIIHIVVLSGYNVMIVAEAIMRLLSYFTTPRTRLIIGVGAIGSFALLVGLSATVVRASIMAVFVLIARATGRVYQVLRGLMIAGSVMLIINPYLLAFDPGFQLSFLATLGLILLAPLIERKLQLVPTKFQVREFLTATIATQIFVSPLLLYLMGSVSLIAVLVNVLVLPAVPFAMLFTFLAGIGGMVHTIVGTTFGFGAYVLLSYIIFVAELFAKIPFALLNIPRMPFVLVILLYCGLGYLIYRFREKKEVSEGKTQETKIVIDGWTIEEDRDEPPKAQSASGGRTSLPFR